MAIVPTTNVQVVKATHEDSVIKEEKVNRIYQDLRNDFSLMPVPIITFPSCIRIEYDADYVNNTVFNPGDVYNLPVFIGYRVWVPDFFFNSFWYPIQVVKNWILFHALIAPFMTISLSVKDAPSWTDIYLSPSNIVVCIRNDYFIVNLSAILFIHYPAPPGSYHLRYMQNLPSFIESRDT